MLLLAIIMLASIGLADSPPQDQGNAATAAPTSPVAQVSFEKNLGQWDSQALYRVHSDGFDAFLASSQLVLVYTEAASQSETVNHSAVFMHFDGASTPLVLSGAQLGQVSNYFRGPSSAWVTGVPHYDSVTYTNLYPFIDLVYHGSDSHLEYDFVVKPGSSPDAIQLRFEGAELSLQEDGRLALTTPVGTAYQDAPTTYQVIAGVREPVASHYVLLGPDTVGFQVEDYNHGTDLVIDPLVYSTYLGGGSVDNAYGIAVDGSGNAYVAGETASSNYPTTPGPFSTDKAVYDAFVTKLAADGSGLVYSDYIGGTSSDNGFGIAVDGSGNAYIAGQTSSTDFPVTAGAFQTTRPGSTDPFVAKLDPTGSSLAYSTYVGGGGVDQANGIAIDPAGNAYIVGTTGSNNFPVTAGAFQATRASTNDAFVAKLNPSGTSLAYSTYLGGTGNEEGNGIAVGADGHAVVAGTAGASFPVTAGAFQTTKPGNNDVFVARLGAAGTGLDYATFVGGISDDQAFAVALDAAGSAYVTGKTSTSGFPTTAGVVQGTFGGNYDAFVTKLNPSGSALSYSTFFGGNAIDEGHAIAVNSAGEAFVAGLTTSSTGFTTTAGAFQTAKNAGTEAFVAKLGAAGTALPYSSYLGGSSTDEAHGIALDGAGAYVTGYTLSSNFPTTAGAYDTTANTNNDAFVTKFGGPSAAQSLTASCGSPHGTSLSWTAPANLGAGPITGYNVYRRAAYGDNLLSNGDLSAWPTSPGAPTGFTVGGASSQTWTRETTKTHSNANAAKVVVIASLPSGGAWISQDVVLAASGSYSIDAWVATDGNGYPRLKVIDVTNGGAIIAAVPGVQNGLAWNQVQATLSLAAGNTYRVQVVNNLASVAGESFYADDIRVRLVQDDTFATLTGTAAGTSFSDAPAYQADGYTYLIKAANAFGEGPTTSVSHVPCDSGLPTASGNPVNAGWVSAGSAITGVSWADSYSGLASAEYSLGTAAGATDIAGWARMPAQPTAGQASAWTPSWTPAGFAQGTNYVNVRVTDQLGNQLTTDGAYVAQFDPSAPTVANNPQAYPWRNTMPTVAGVSWTDAASGLASVEYSIGGVSGGVGVTQGWLPLPVQPSAGQTTAFTPSFQPNDLLQGTNYVNVRLTDVAGNTATTNGAYTIQYDVVQPVMTSSPASYSWTPTTPQLGGVTFQDVSTGTASGLRQTVQYAVGTSSGASNVVAWTDLPAQPALGQTTAWTPQWTPSLLAPGMNYVSIRMQDIAGTPVKTFADAYTVQYDATAPAVSGAPSNLGWQHVVTQSLSGVTWTDATAGLAASAQYSIGTSSGGIDVVAWTTMPAQPSAGQTTAWNPTWTPAQLRSGQNYVSIRVTDGAGNQAATTDAYLIQYDGALPTISGNPQTTPWQAATAAISGVSWTDTLSGLAANAQYSIGTSSGAVDIQGWANAPAAAQPPSGQTTPWGPNWVPTGVQPGTNYVNMRVLDRAGNQLQSNGAYVVRVDSVPPTVAGNPKTLDWSKVNPTTSTVTWQDTASGLASATYSIGTTSGGNNVLDWTATPSQPSGTAPWTPQFPIAGSLPQGLSYVNVRVTDAAGFTTQTNGAYVVRYDTGAPSASANPTLYTWTKTIPQLGVASWTDSVSGLNTAEYAVGTTSGGTNVRSWAAMPVSPGGTTSTWTPQWTPASLGQGLNYISVRVTDTAGTTTTTLDAYRVQYDNVLPTSTAPQVFTWRNTGATLNGVTFQDPTSGLQANVQYSVGTTSGGFNVVAWTLMTSQPSTPAAAWTPSWSPSSLAQGMNYVNVRLTDFAGNVQTVNGAYTVQFETAPPTITGNPVSTPWQQPTVALTGVSWQDTLSGLAATVQYSVGSSNGGINVKAWTALPAGSQPSAGNTNPWSPLNFVPTLAPSTNYVNMRVTDQAGNQLTTNGAWIVQADGLAPTITGNPKTTDWVTTVPSLANVTWQDTLSGLAGTVQYSIGTTNGGVNVKGWTTLPSQPDPSRVLSWTPTWTPSATLQPGLNYVNMRVTDMVGNQVTTNGAYVIQFDNSAEPITGLVAKSGPGGAALASTWQADNTPYYEWTAPNSAAPIVGYSYTVDGTDPDDTVEVASPFVDRASAPVPDGTVVFKVRAKDAAGNLGPIASVTLQVDASAPQGTGLDSPSHPDEARFYNRTEGNVTWSYVDDGSGLAGYYTALVPVAGNCPASMPTSGLFQAPGNATRSFSGLASFGTWLLCIQAKDNVGNLAPVDYWIINVDTVAPAFTTVTPANQTNLADPQGVVRVEFADGDGGLDTAQQTKVNPASVKLLVDDIDVQAVWGPLCAQLPMGMCGFDVASDHVEFKPLVPFVQGNHTIYVVAQDDAVGPNTATLASFFIVDATGGATGDFDGDQVTDSLEFLVCKAENIDLESDGTCNSAGTDWLPPHFFGVESDASELVEAAKEAILP